MKVPTFYALESHTYRLREDHDVVEEILMLREIPCQWNGQKYLNGIRWCKFSPNPHIMSIESIHIETRTNLTKEGGHFLTFAFPCLHVWSLNFCNNSLFVLLHHTTAYQSNVGFLTFTSTPTRACFIKLKSPTNGFLYLDPYIFPG